MPRWQQLTEGWVDLHIYAFLKTFEPIKRSVPKYPMEYETHSNIVTIFLVAWYDHHWKCANCQQKGHPITQTIGSKSLRTCCSWLNHHSPAFHHQNYLLRSLPPRLFCGPKKYMIVYVYPPLCAWPVLLAKSPKKSLFFQKIAGDFLLVSHVFCYWNPPNCMFYNIYI